MMRAKHKKISKFVAWLGADGVVVGVLVAVTFLVGGVLASVGAKADANTVVDRVTVVIPAACSMAGTIEKNEEHTKDVVVDTYYADIGTTNLKVFCNDFAGFSVYAIGYTGDTDGNNTMVGTNTNQTIATGLAQSGNTSNWAMKLTKVTNPGGGDPDITYNPGNLSITDGTDDYNGVYRTVPDEYTKVAEYHAASGPSTTDQTLGSNMQTTYAFFASGGQVADTYVGKVKYVLIHPADLEVGTYTLAYSSGGGGGTMTSDTNLPNYEPHTIKANTFTAPSGYVFLGWCTVPVNGATAQNPQTICEGESYPNGGTLPASPSVDASAGETFTLYAYWGMTFDKAYAAAGKTKSGGYYVMQDMNSTDICNNVAKGQTTTLKDSRDGKNYTVAKLADGNCWMTQNLDHNIGDISGGTYTPVDTDIPRNWTPDVSYYTRETENTDWCTVDDCDNEPESYDPGDVCWLGEGEYENDDTCEKVHYHLGNYYNWTAAVAMSDSSQYENEYIENNGEYDENTGQYWYDVDQSICPAGWRLPLGGSEVEEPVSKSFAYLAKAYGWTTDSYMMENLYIWGDPLYFPLSGGWYGDLGDVGGRGYYWSSVVNYSDHAYGLYSDDGGCVYPDVGDPRSNGYSVRCVAR